MTDRASPEPQRLALSISGMHCASCVRRVEQSLLSVPGVTNAAVNLATEKAQVDFDPAQAGEEQLAAAVAAVGFQAQVLKASQPLPPPAPGTLPAPVWTALGIAALLLWGTFPGLERTAPAVIRNPWFQLVLATIVQLWAGRSFYLSAFKSFRHGTATMDTLVVVGTTAAYAYSLAMTAAPQLAAHAGIHPMPYFDVSAVILALILLGRSLEMRARRRTSDAIRKLITLQPKTARVISAAGEQDIPIEQVTVGMLIRIRPGERIPVDGMVRDGTSTVDEAMITGESIPVLKHPGSRVIGGTINKTGAFIFEAQHVGAETMLAQIVRLVESAQASKAPIQRLADTVAGFFVPTVLVLGVLTFLLWFTFGPEPRTLYGILNAVAVLIVACPCAMGLATPTAIIVGTGRGAQLGVLIRDAASLERAHRITAVMFDKTGTLTTGAPEVADLFAVEGQTTEAVLRLAASLEKQSEHPLGEAVLRRAAAEQYVLLDAISFSSDPGRGIRGLVNGIDCLFGNEAYLAANGIAAGEAGVWANEREARGQTVVLLAANGKAAGAIAFSDTLKESARAGIALLSAAGIAPMMITGDNPRTAQAAAEQLGISRVFSQLLPQQKAEKVQAIRKEGHCVAFVGDGINDAPALASADIGIALSTGTDVAIEASDITLVNRDLRAVAWAIELSKRTMRTIRFNLFWAFIYNILLIPVAMGALYPWFGIRMNPIYASVAMALSSIFVVTNSLRLKRARLGSSDSGT